MTKPPCEIEGEVEEKEEEEEEEDIGVAEDVDGGLTHDSWWPW